MEYRTQVVFVRLTADEYKRVLKASPGSARKLGPWARSVLLDRCKIIESQDRTHPMPAERSELKRRSSGAVKKRRASSKRKAGKRSRGRK